MCNPTHYKNVNDDLTRLYSRYKFPTPLVEKTHFDKETNLLHLIKMNYWLNNANLWITMGCRCNHDFKLIATSGKDGKT